MKRQSCEVEVEVEVEGTSVVMYSILIALCSSSISITKICATVLTALFKLVQACLREAWGRVSKTRHWHKMRSMRFPQYSAFDVAMHS